ncbi:ABC transporter permease [Roseicyclus marinus]|uniref:ABC transporter permease n=1 Tax=Roseicyclus marinus TaxID=2161673 RepID=UPI00240FE3C0|nr:ABC transporter permease [Roseicyclus marinus]MDG3042459.1 ABC transporter permease [Roseicyclus marinus]
MSDKISRDISSALRTIWRQRRLLINTTRADIQNQFAGTALGLLWVVLGPMTLLALYTIIYAFIFRVRVPDYTVQEYILNVFSGLVPFLAFSQALAMSATVMRRDQKLLFSSYPNIFIPIKAVLTSYVIVGVGTLLIFLGDLAVSEVTWTLLLVPIVMLLQMIFSIGIGMIIALFSVVLKDIEVMIQYITIALLVITPIAYTPEMIPSGLKPLLYVNPLFYFTYSNQYLILVNELPPIHIMVIATFLSASAFFTGLWFFTRARQALNDLL